MSKKALFNFFTDGVTYEKDKVYSDEQVAHLDPSNFVDVGGQASVATPVQEVKESETAELDSGKVEDVKTDEVKTEEQKAE